MPKPRTLVLAGLAVVALVFGGRQLLGAATPHLYAGTVLQQSSAAPSMDGLRFADGTEVDVKEFDDEVTLVYFGYTNCPDVCPTTLSAASDAIWALPEDDQNRVNLLMVTVDPIRDEPQELQQYVEFFDSRFLGVSGATDDIDRVASQYGIFYDLGDGSAEDGYVVDHTATMMAIGTDGALRIVWPPTVTAEDLSQDIEELLKQ